MVVNRKLDLMYKFEEFRKKLEFFHVFIKFTVGSRIANMC